MNAPAKGRPARALLAVWTDLARLRQRVWLPLGMLLLAVLLAFGVWSSDLSSIDAVATILMYVTLVQGWNVLGGYGGYMNFGMAAFFGVGAYTSAILAQLGWASPFLAVLAAGLVGALFGLVLGALTLRLRGAYFAIATLIATFAVQLAVLNASFTGGSMGLYLKLLPFGPAQTEQLFFFVFLALAVAATAVLYLIEHSNFGWALVAIREDEDAAEVLGVKTTQVKISGLVLGALMAGLVGGIYSYRVLFIETSGTFSLDISLDVVLMAVLGGAGYWQGALIGTPILMLIADVLRVGIAAAVNRVIFGALLIVIAIFVPNGVMGLIRRVRGRRFMV
ncbi:MAG TPA: branched-chain amino acid ABC transporter permease [Candidatus Acidoferrales bacterium]|nr:branched-chain amino acid ABC transporter permease [Candidatus Acidoferrales bacterium]